MPAHPIKMHRLFDVAIEKTKDIKLPITFRTSKEIKITVKDNGKDDGIAIAVEHQRNNHLAREEFLLHHDGGCRIHIFAQVRSITGLTVHTLQKTEEYTHDRVIASANGEKIGGLHNQLDLIASLLNDPSTVIETTAETSVLATRHQHPTHAAVAMRP